MKTTLRAALAALCTAGMLSTAQGCDEPTPPPEPTEPWRAGEKAKRAPGTDQRTLVADVAGEARLAFRLPAKEASATGSVGGLGGAFTIELGDLGRTRGTVLFDLSTLVIAADGAGDDPERTTEAQNWLGLGLGTRAEEHRRLRYARFEVDALHDPTATRVDATKAIPSTDGKARLLQLRAVAVGRLVIRNLAVARRVPVDLEFRFGPQPRKDELPTGVTVRLRAAEVVPLAEHDIAPRDSAGTSLPSGLPLLGRVVGKSALVSGEIALRPRVL